MEPFGLLHFLKSVFPALDAPTASPPPVSEETPQRIDPDRPQKSVPPAESSTTQNAFTAFIAAHDARIKHIKR